MGRRTEVVARARALVGARFRLQGRSVETGLDCVGVAMMATGSSERDVRRDYCLRSNDADAANDNFDLSGFIRIDPAAAGPGDILVVRPGPAALHVLVLSEDGYVHADMRLRRVVEVPGKVPWPAISAWRHPAVAAEDPLASELVGPSMERN